jgi:hypothetical protein
LSFKVPSNRELYCAIGLSLSDAIEAADLPWQLRLYQEIKKVVKHTCSVQRSHDGTNLCSTNFLEFPSHEKDNLQYNQRNWYRVSSNKLRKFGSQVKARHEMFYKVAKRLGNKER